jgi:protein O-GlcNAc transferase
MPAPIVPQIPGLGGKTKEAAPVQPDATHLTEAADAHTAGGDYAEAIEVYERALTLGAATPQLHHNLGRALYEMGEIPRATRHFETAAATCDAIGPWLALATTIPGDPGASNERILEVRRAFAARLESLAPARASGPAPDPPDGRIRVGYLSSWFDHANYMRPVWSLLKHLDRASFEVHLFSDTLPADMPGFTPQPGDRTHWTGLLDNDQLASFIRACGIHILVDLNGYSAPRRLAVFLEPPAPVTLGWFNLYATSGLRGIQYIVGDRQVVQPGEEIHFTERVLRLPVSYLTFEGTHAAPPVVPPPCSTAGFLTFGSLASQYKINPAVLDCWSAILRRTKNTRLLIANNALTTAGNRAYLANRFAERGVETERLILLGPADHTTFLRHYDRIDIALDTHPYSGGTTTMEALWQGVPVLTVEGDRWASRTTRSLLHYAGLGDFVARDAVALEDLAVGLARDPASRGRLERWRVGQRQGLAASPVCDAVSLGRHMARVYKALLRHERALRSCPGPDVPPRAVPREQMS